MGTENNHYPGFQHTASDLSAYTFAVDTFIISLKNGKVIRFHTEDPEKFKNWLSKHRVRNVNGT